MSKCGGCGRYVSPTNAVKLVKCKRCHQGYHKSCVGMTGRDIVPSDWCCPECKMQTAAKPRNDDTPLRQAQPDRSSDRGLTPESPTQPTPSTSPMHSSDESQEGPGSREFGLLMAETKALRADVMKFQRRMELEVASIKESVLTCGTRIDGIEARLQSLEERCGGPAGSGDPGIGSIAQVVENLKRELNNRDQELLANNVEISGVPELSGENLVHVLRTLGDKLGVAVDERDIVSVERVGRRVLDATSPQGPREPRPRVLVARLARRDLRDELLKGARVRRTTTTEGVVQTSAASPRRFYVNERLTKVHRQLFHAAQESAGAAGWRFVWTRRGRILACRGPGDRTHRIESEADLPALFGRRSDSS